MERTAFSLPRLHATSLAIALLVTSTGQSAQAATNKAALAGNDPGVPTARASGTPVTLNFVNADIEAVSRAIGSMLNRDILVDPRVKGTITVYNDKPQPLADAYRNYLSALRGLGFTVVESGGFLKVVPEADAKLQASTVSVGSPQQRGDQVLTQIFKLNHENPNNLVAVLRPLITANNTINASPGTNSLVITDYADNLQRIGKIITALDQPAGAQLDVIALRNSVASDIVQTVQKLIDGGGLAATPGAPAQTGATSVVVDNRTNSLIVRAPNGERMAYAHLIIDKLDQPTAGGGPAGNIWVVYLKNADATKLAEVLRAAIAAGNVNGAAGGGSGASSGGGGASRESTPTATPASTNGNGGSTQSAQSTTPVAASARPSTGGQIQADPATNSLIITATEPQYRQMRSVIDQLDVRRAQVYVESMMVSVDATKAAEFGVQWQGLLGSGGKSYVGAGTNFGSSSGNIINLAVGASALASGGTSTTSTTSTTNVASLIGNGLNIGYVPKINGVYTLAALANFLETNTGANVLATPNVVALDNEEAKIVIGQNIPLTTGSYTNTSGNSSSVNPFQTVERQDIGITLRIKSQIGENGTVRMTVYEENSSVDPNFATNQITNKTSVETYITVDDGTMVVLGGLTRDEYGDTQNGVPLLSSIPILGNLFKNSNRTRHKQTLMLFLRPIVMRDQSDSNKLTVDRYNAIREQQQSFQPDKSYITRINDTPVVPAVKGDTQVDPSTPHDPQTESIRLPSLAPVPDMRRVPAAPVTPMIPLRPEPTPTPVQGQGAAAPAPAPVAPAAPAPFVPVPSPAR